MLYSVLFHCILFKYSVVKKVCVPHGKPQALKPGPCVHIPQRSVIPVNGNETKHSEQQQVVVSHTCRHQHHNGGLASTNSALVEVGR